MLTSRQIEILKLIVDDFISTGQPVGSRRLSKLPSLNVSPATIRNEMADLEDFGYVLQPHISAGRIPSEQGLRFYVDSLLDGHELTTAINNNIRSLYLLHYDENISLLRQAARVISDNAEMTVIITEPRFTARRLTNLKLLKMNSSKVLLVLITDGEEVKTLVLNADDFSQEVLDNLTTELSTLMLDRSLEEISFRDINKIKSRHLDQRELIDYILPVLKEVLRKLNKEHIVVAGREYLLRSEYFSDIDIARRAIETLKDPMAVLALLDNQKEGIGVRIGAELGNQVFNEFSMVQCNFNFGGGQSGQIALLGPKRMDYSKAISIVEVGAKTLTDLFSGIHL